MKTSFRDAKGRLWDLRVNDASAAAVEREFPGLTLLLWKGFRWATGSEIDDIVRRIATATSSIASIGTLAWILADANARAMIGKQEFLDAMHGREILSARTAIFLAIAEYLPARFGLRELWDEVLQRGEARQTFRRTRDNQGGEN